MTVNRGLYVRNNGSVGTTPTEARLVQAAMIIETVAGTPRQGLLHQVDTNVVTGTANMSYNVSAITPVITRAANEGVYIMTLTGTNNVATTAAPGSGSRYDLIYVKQNDIDKGDADNAPVLAVQNGTASAGTPTKPYADLPAGAYVLAEAQVFSGATATNGGSVTITQVWNYTALRGAPVKVRSAIERDVFTVVGTEVIRLDAANRHEFWDGTNWKIGPEPLGMVANARIQSNSGVITSATTIVNNIQSYDFKAGRRYRILWQSNYYESDSSTTFAMGISTCSPSDPAAQTTGLTQLGSISERATVANEGRSFKVQVYYYPSADITRQVKGWVLRVVGGGSIVIQADITNFNDLVIEDLGDAY